MSDRMDPLRGIDRLRATSALLQRIRRAHATAGVWEAADVQWWWRRPRVTDELPLPVWSDASGPVAAAVLTAWPSGIQADALVVPGTMDPAEVWATLLDAAQVHGCSPLEVLARDDDHRLLSLLDGSGFVATEERSGITWMDANDRPAAMPPPSGHRVVDRREHEDVPHPMRPRNGDEVEERLRQCPLYDPALDLSIETDAGEPAAYALFWFDAATGVGMLEPMRVEEAHQRRGLGRALLIEGLDRLARLGAERLKVGFDGPAGRALYLGAGFEVAASVRNFRRPSG